jgi:hypothetical protein
VSNLENAEDRRSGPGPWFVAQLEGNCSRCGDLIEPGDTIRADGWGSWECCDEEENSEIAAAIAEAHAEREAAQRYVGTSDEEMGF